MDVGFRHIYLGDLGGRSDGVHSQWRPELRSPATAGGFGMESFSAGKSIYGGFLGLGLSQDSVGLFHGNSLPSTNGMTTGGQPPI